MRRLFRTTLAALAGSTAGYVVHQLKARKSMDEDDARADVLTVGAPLLNTAAAALFGLAAGRHGRGLAFISGFAVSVTAGARLDDMVPALKAAGARAREMAAAHNESHHAS